MKGQLFKIFSLILSVVMCASLCTFITFAEESTTTEYDFSYLQNTYAKIMAGETVNIAYLGGSVTNGYAGVNPTTGESDNCQNANDGKECWREGTFRWFNETFAQTSATFVENHAAIGGTGSDLNTYRTENALKLGTANAADLVFIEFSINDSYEGLTQAESAEYMEAIVRRIYASDPYTDIAIIVVTDNGKTNTEYPNALGHKEIAEAYDIPILWVGKDLYNYVAALEGGVSENWYTYFADGCHPNVNGHAIYTQSIIDNYLVPNLTSEGLTLDSSKRTAKVMPDPLYDGGFWNSYERFAGATATGFSGYGFGSDGTKIYANVGGGDSFNITFYGTGIGFRYTASDTNGLVQFNVDGGTYSYMDFRNPGSNGGTNHKMLVQGLDEGWHEMNVILRKTVSGSSLVIHSFFVDGDAAQNPFTFGTPPTSAPITDIVVSDIILTPSLLDTTISGTDYANTGSVRTVETAIIDDVDTISYVPNPESSDYIASDCYNSTYKSVTIPEYKYVTVGYHYVVPEDITPSAKRMMINFLQLANSGSTSSTSYKAYSAQSGYKLNESDELIFDITVLSTLGVSGSLYQMHFYPMGLVKGNAGSNMEKMHVKNVIFHADYPYDSSPVAIDLSSADVSGTAASADTLDESDVTKVVASGVAALGFEGLDELEMFPSVYQYVQMEYFAESGSGTPVLHIPTLDNGAFTAAGASAITTGQWAKVTFNLSDIADINGQSNFYKDAVLYPYGNAESDGTIYIKSVKFFNAYPDPDATFAISFDLNGGNGTVPSDLVAKIGSKVTLPSCSATKDGMMFAGWAEASDATTILTNYYMPENGSTLYAVWVDRPTVFVSASDTTITYGGVENTVEYTTLSDALAALGTSGGTIVMTGDLDFADLSDIATGCLGIEFIGADDTACLVGFNSNYTMTAPLSLENVDLIRTADGNRYFFTKGHKLEIGKNCGFYSRTTDETTGEITLTALKLEILSSIASGNAEYVLGTADMGFGVIGFVYTSNFTGNATITIDGANLTQSVLFYPVSWEVSKGYTFSGNANVIINSGSLSGVNLDGHVDGTGAKTLIYNNGMKATHTDLSSGFDYVIDSSLGGEVYIKTPATATTAPTFTAAAAKSAYEIKINGQSVGFGSYDFTPTAEGTYDIDFVAPSCTLTFDANGGEGQAPDSVTTLSDTVVTLPTDVAFTKLGYTFHGWSETANHAVILGETYTIGTENKTLYAVWQKNDEFFVNSDGSGKLTMNGIEYVAPYSTLVDAANAITSPGGTIYLSGEGASGTDNAFNNALANKGTVILCGADANAAAIYHLQTTTLKLFCNMEYRNITLDKDQLNVSSIIDPYHYCNGFSLTIGTPDIENDVIMTTTSADGTVSQGALKFIGPNTGSGNSHYIINSGRYETSHGAAGYSNNVTGNSYMEINGGTFITRVNGGILGWSDSSYTLNGNSTVVINGGTITNHQVVFTRISTCTGKKTVIFNNGMAKEYTTVSDADYIIKSTADGFVSEYEVGKKFLVTPNDTSNVPYVNGVALTADQDGNYLLVPEENGTFDIVYAPISNAADVTVEFSKTDENPPIIKTAETDGFDYNSSAKISLYTESGSLVDCALETELENGTHTFEGIITGNYYIVIEKNGYLTYTSDVFELSAGAVLPLDGIELIPGDIKGSYDDLAGDGVVDIDDFLRLIRAFASDADEKLRVITDINESGNVNMEDLAQLKAWLGKTTASYKNNN